jgi:hypothetical protein
MAELSELPPPRKGAKAGYYPDPLGSGRARWWDGAHWSHMLGPLVAADARRGKPLPPPTKVCPRCGAQSETFETSCPNCGRAYGLNRGAIVGIIAAGIGASLLFLGGCATLIVLGVNEAEEEVDETSISRAQFESIPIGASRGEVERRLGDFWNQRREESVGGDRLQCIYYNEEGSSVFDDEREFGFCFIGGELVSKTTPEYDPPSD